MWRRWVRKGKDAKEVAALENGGKTETWKAKEEMDAEPGGGSEDYAGQKVGCREEWGSVVREAKVHPGL
jgi:hypothetical protein